jgi:N utilization substance protein B
MTTESGSLGQNARTAARVASVQGLYQMDLAQTDLNAVIEEFETHRFRQAEQDNPIAGADPTFFAELLRGVLRRQREIDPLVDQQLAMGWRLGRVDSILRAILRAGVFELLERPDVPARVVINEYIEIAHAFFSEDEPKVVNGILDKLARRLRPAEFARKSGDKSSEKPAENPPDKSKIE